MVELNMTPACELYMLYILYTPPEYVCVIYSIFCASLHAPRRMHCVLSMSLNTLLCNLNIHILTFA